MSPARWSLWVRGGVEAVLTRHPIDDGRLQLVGTDPIGVYRNPDVLPRAWLATRWRPVPDLAGAARWMLEEGVDQLEIPAIEGAPASGEGGPLVALDWDAPDSDHRVIHLPADAPAGFVGLIESWDEGWTAAVDGVATPVQVANGYQVAIAVPAGAREVRLAYRPPGMIAGGAITVTSMLLLAFWAIIERRRSAVESVPAPTTPAAGPRD